MPNLDKLQEAIKDSGMTITAIANKSGISRDTLYNRFKGVGEFTCSEMVGLAETLHLDTEQREEIFLQ